MGFEPTVPLPVHLISSQGRYNHFDTTPYSVQPEKMSGFRAGGEMCADALIRYLFEKKKSSLRAKKPHLEAQSAAARDERAPPAARGLRRLSLKCAGVYYIMTKTVKAPEQPAPECIYRKGGMHVEQGRLDIY